MGGFDPTKHPRVPAGSAQGGEFTAAGDGGLPGTNFPGRNAKGVGMFGGYSALRYVVQTHRLQERINRLNKPKEPSGRATAMRSIMTRVKRAVSTYRGKKGR